jgi:hypothetical protein
LISEDLNSDLAIGSRAGDALTLRRLKILVILLILSNIALGVFGFCFLRAIDRNYTNLIGRSVPTLNDLQTQTAVSMEAMRSTNPILFSEASANRADLVERARRALERDRVLRGAVLKREWLSAGNVEGRDFREAGEAFAVGATRIITLLDSGDLAEAGRQREKELRPVFDRYVAATTKAADVLEEESLRTSGALTAGTLSTSKIMLGLASWPVMLLGAFLLITAVFVIAVLVKVFLFREETA